MRARLTSMLLTQMPILCFAQVACPSAPQQISRDASVAVTAAVGRLGPVKAGEFSTNVSTTTRDLVTSLQKADVVYLEQMMFAAFCSSVRDDESLKKSERSRALAEYAREVRRSISARNLEPVKPRAIDPNKPSPIPLPEAKKSKSLQFSVLLDVLGLPSGSNLGWNTDYEVFERLFPPSDRAISKVELIGLDRRAQLGGAPTRTMLYFQNRKLIKASLVSSAQYYEYKTWVLREPPVPEKTGSGGDVQLGRQICSQDFARQVESKLSAKFSRTKNTEQNSTHDKAYKRDGYECNKYGCALDARVTTITSAYTHDEAANVAFEAELWKGVATYKLPGTARDGGEFNDWICNVSVTFTPKVGGGI